MPLKTIVSPIKEPEKFSEAVDAAMHKIQEEFIFFNRKHMGKVAEVQRSVTFHVTPEYLVCILYYSWNLADQSALWKPGAAQVPPGRMQ